MSLIRIFIGFSIVFGFCQKECLSNGVSDLTILHHPTPKITAEISANTDQSEPIKNQAVPVFMIIMGIGMAGIWATDIAKGKFTVQGYFWQWREGENLLWPHLCAEYLTALALIVGGIGLFWGEEWATPISLAALGALTYSAINSSGWVLANRKRLVYGIPIWIGLAGTIASFWVLLS